MKIPFCSFCIRSGILCSRCQEKVQSGQVSKLDIRIAKLFLKLEEKYSSLQKISFYNAYEVDGVLAIVVGRGDLHNFLSGSGRMMREIAESTGKKIRILEKGGDMRRFFEDLFAPLMVTTINTIWLPDGTTEIRVVLSGYRRRLPLKTNVLKELAKKIRGITLRIAFEAQSKQNFR